MARARVLLVLQRRLLASALIASVLRFPFCVQADLHTVRVVPHLKQLTGKMRVISPEKPSPTGQQSECRRFSDEFYDEDEQLSRLFEACCQRGRAGSVVDVLNKNEQWVHVNSKGASGDTGLHFAARSANLEGCKLLLEKGAKVDALNFLNTTPLGKACAVGHLVSHDILVFSQICLLSSDCLLNFHGASP